MSLHEAEKQLQQIGGDAGAKRHECLALVRSTLGNVLVAQGKPREAVEPLTGAVQAYTDLAATDPDYPPYLEGLASANLYLGTTLRPLGRVKQERRAFEQAINDYSQLAQAQPDVAYFRENLAVAQAGLARALHLSHQNRAAAKLAARLRPNSRRRP